MVLNWKWHQTLAYNIKHKTAYNYMMLEGQQLYIYDARTTTSVYIYDARTTTSIYVWGSAGHRHRQFFAPAFQILPVPVFFVIGKIIQHLHFSATFKPRISLKPDS